MGRMSGALAFCLARCLTELGLVQFTDQCNFNCSKNTFLVYDLLGVEDLKKKCKASVVSKVDCFRLLRRCCMLREAHGFVDGARQHRVS